MAIRYNNSNINVDNNPWAGLASYEDPETAERALKFCGRDDDSYDLARLIMGNVFVTLYGKSGIGKTSLLNAGVFPELRQEPFTPISLRIGMRDEEHLQCYQAIITEAIERAVKRTEIINVIDEQQDQQSIDYLWNYFARHQFYDKYDEQTTPVIVFDQFEEVFRGYRDEAETLLRQLDYLNDKDHRLDNYEVDGIPYRYKQNFRFVVSIREDDLYCLEDSLDNCYLPALKRCRYRLRSLSEEGAREAILIPGEGLFDSKEENSIVNKIIDKSRNENGSISTNIISLLSSRIYVEYKRSGADHITPSLVDSFLKGNPFERFYNEATSGFTNREKSYIESHLVDSTGRRNSMPESDFLLHIKNGTKLLEGSTRILQRISTSSDGRNYHRVELIHDSFCEPLVHLREKRERKKRLKWLASATVLIILWLSIILSIITLYCENKNLISDIRELHKERNELREEKEELHEEMDVLENEIDLFRNQFKNKDGNGSVKSNADLNITFVYDGISYSRYGFFEQSDFDNWKSNNEKLFQKKIPRLLKDSLQTLEIPNDMMENEMGLVYLILSSRSINDIKEKQSWFDLYSIMDTDQINRLYDILARENYKLAVLTYRDKANILNSKAYEYAYDGNYGEALKTIDEAIEQSHLEYANKFDSKGEILLMKGDTQEAVKMWNKVLEISPNFLDYHDGSTPFYEQLRKRGLIK